MARTRIGHVQLLAYCRTTTVAHKWGLLRARKRSSSRGVNPQKLKFRPKKRPLAKPAAVKLIAMNPTPPLTLTDLASDGLFLATAHDMCWKQLKEVQGIELNFSSAPAESGNDLPVDVRVYTAQGTVDFKGRRIAVLSDTTWRWATARKRDPAISQLHGEQPLSELLLAAARTLEGGNPI